MRNKYQQAQFDKKREKWGKVSRPHAYLYRDHPGMVWYKKRRIWQVGIGDFLPSNFVVPSTPDRWDLDVPEVLRRKAYGPSF